MMNKKKYETPLTEVLDLGGEDIVTASPNNNITPDSDNYEGDIIKYNYQRP